VHVRLREPVVIYLVMFGMALAWMHFLLGRDALGSYGLAVVTLKAWGTFGRVDLGGRPPRPPTDPDVRVKRIWLFIS
jgi:hypothetical protein